MSLRLRYLNVLVAIANLSLVILSGHLKPAFSQTHEAAKQFVLPDSAGRSDRPGAGRDRPTVTAPANGREALSQSPSTPSLAAANGLQEQAFGQFEQGQYEDAIATLQQLLTLHQQTGNAPEEVVTLNNLGVIYAAAGNQQQSLSFYEQALQRMQQVISDPQYSYLFVRVDQSNPSSASTLDLQGVAVILANLARRYELNENSQLALSLYNQALHPQQWLASVDSTIVIGTLRTSFVLEPPFLSPEDIIQQAVQQVQEQEQTFAVAYRVGAGTFLRNISDVAATQTHVSAHITHRLEDLQQQLIESRTRNDRLSNVRILREMGDYYRQLRQFAQARAAYEEALQVYQEIGDRTGQADILTSLGNLYAEAGGTTVAIADDDASTNAEIVVLTAADNVGLGERVDLSALLNPANDERGNAGDIFVRGESFSEVPERIETTHDNGITITTGDLMLGEQRRPSVSEAGASTTNGLPNADSSNEAIAPDSSTPDLFQDGTSYVPPQRGLTGRREAGINQRGEGLSTLPSTREATSAESPVEAEPDEAAVNRSSTTPLSGLLQFRGVQGERIPMRLSNLSDQTLQLQNESLRRDTEQGNGIPPQSFNPPDQGLEGISEPLSGFSRSNLGIAAAVEPRNENEQPAIAPSSSYEQALTNYQQALRIYRETGRPYEEAEVLNSIGSVYLETGNYDQAMAYFQQALALFQQQLASVSTLDERSFQLLTSLIGSRGEILFPGLLATTQANGEPQAAQRFAVGTATVLNNIGEVYRYRGYYTQALDAYEAARDTFQQLNTPEGTAAALNNLGLIRNELGQYETALTFYQQSLALRERHNLPRQAISLHNIGFVYDQLQQDDRALTYYRQALVLQQQNNDLVGTAITRNNLGLLFSDRGQHHLALQELNIALNLFQQVGDRPSIGNTLDSIATVYKNQQQFDQAETYYRQAIDILTITENRTVQGIVLTNLGDLYERMGQPDKAIATYQEAIDSVFETILADLRGEELRSRFADKHADTYARLINLLWNQRRYEDAFNYVERARARSFLSQIVSGPVNLRAGAAANLLQQEQQLRTEIETLNEQLQSLNRHARTSDEMDALARLRNTLTTREQEYANLLSRLQRQNPAAADLLSVTPAMLPEIQRFIAPDTILVEYFVMDDRTLVFLVSRDRPLVPITLNVSRQSLSEAINTLYEYDFAALDNPHPQSLRQLYTWLIEPLRSYLPPGSRLQIVPHNILHYVPFAALTDGNRYLMDDFAIANLPSANVMRFLEEPSTPGRFPLLSLGNSTFDLPSSKAEVQQISTLYNTQPLLGDRASEAIVWNQAGQSTILHLATHGEYNPISPLFSTLFLAPSDDYDGQLQTHEIYGLDLTQSTRLVVLSACQAQFGRFSRGDEIVGLSRAFMYAGTPKVLASLWSIDDQATRVLMENFYANLQQTSNEAESLQRAQQTTRRMYPHPYYWASFVMNGLPH